MAFHLGLSSPEPLDPRGVQTQVHKLRNCNSHKHEGRCTRVATLLTVIGNDAIDVFNTLTWDAEADDKNIDKLLEKFEEYREPRKNLFSWAQESGETIDQYVTVLRNLSET